MIRLLMIASALMAVGGCAAPPVENLPPYAWVDAPTAMHALCERSARVQSLSSGATLTLTRADGGGSVRLDAAIVMRPPDSVRMRAWKFGQSVFDLTLTPDGLWIEAPDDPDRRGQIMPASLSAAKMARSWAVISGQFFCSSDYRISGMTSRQVSVERRVGDQRVTCEVDRETLTPRRYRVLDAAGTEHFDLMLDRYQMLAGVPWATHLVAKSEGGTIDIVLNNPELNGELAPNAFVPPRKARKMP